MPATQLPERPALHPWCRLVRDEGRYLLEHGGTVVTLEGRAAETLLPRLLSLLDGSRTVDDLIAEVGAPVAPAVESALSLLSTHRLLVEGVGHDPAPASTTAVAAYAAAVSGVTESRARRELDDGMVAVLGSGNGAAEVVRQLRDMGIGRVDRQSFDAELDRGSFVVAAPAPDELPRLGELNTRSLERRLAWLQLLPFDGRLVIVGPVYLPWQSACRACFVLRRGACSGYEEDFGLIEHEPPRVTAPIAVAALGASLAALLTIRWLAAADPTLPGRFYALDARSTVRLSYERLLRVPRCPSCGPVVRAMPSPWFEERA